MRHPFCIKSGRRSPPGRDHKHMKPITTIAMALAMAHGAAFAADADLPERERDWTVSAELGAITTTGNTAGTSVTGKIDARQELEDWSNEYIFSGYFQ